jgi:phosphoribosylanthranilate isomerase
MKVKVCGMCDGENIRQVAELGVDYIGMVFWPKSARFVSMVPSRAGILPDRAGEQYTRPQVKTVGVFVDDMPQNIITRVVSYRLDVVQLHGQESPTLVRNLRATLTAGGNKAIAPGLQIWKAISVGCREDVEQWRQYADCVDAFLFDTRSDGVGGSGRQFDWTVLDAYDGQKPFWLSGGIGPDDAQRVADFCSTHPLCVGVDLNSRFETEPGLKDVDMLRGFLQKVATLTQHQS